jgi:hypothetical protein
MSSRIQRSAKILAAVTGAYLLYSLIAVPLIEPALNRQESLFSTVPEAASGALAPLRDANLESLFAPGDWELDNPMVLTTDRGMLLVRDYRTREDGDLELVPCTLIVCGSAPGDSESGERGQRLVLLRSPQGALIRFDRPLDLSRGQFGRLVGGWLMGPVTIQSPETQPGANDALDLRTDSVQITRQRIVAPHEVVFRYGDNSGRGRDLIMTLDPPAAASTSSKGFRDAGFGQLRSVEIVHVESLKLQLPAPDNESPAKRNAAENQTALPREVEITCRGPFRLDLERLTASLRDQVEMVQRNRDGPNDRLTCDVLSIYLRHGDPREKPRRRESAEGLSALSTLEVERIVLQGAPVVLDMPSQSVAARAGRMEYHFPTRQIRISDDRQAELRYEQNEFRAAEVEYTPADDGRLGRLLAKGAGQLRGTLPGGEPLETFEASWQNGLIVQPHQGDHAVSLLGAARVRYQGMGEFAAENLHLWLQETPQPDGDVEAPRFAYQPVRMLADRDVRVDSPQLAGATQKVEVWIRYEEATPGPDAAAKNPRSPSGRNPQSSPTVSDQKFDLVGNHLQVQLLRRGTETVVEHLILAGDVRLREIQTAKPGETPLDVVGDLVQLEYANTPRTRMLVRGNPARIAARDVGVAGENVQLNRERNRLWITGPGTMALPLASNPLPGNRDPQTAPSPGKMTVEWKTQMQFDGRTARFEGDVRLRGQQPSGNGEVFDLLVAGSDLEVGLTRRIDFSDDKPPADMGVGSVLFRGDVVLQNTGHRLGMQTSIDRMHVRDLNIDQPSGRLQAAGPGWGTSVRRSEQMPGLGAAGQTGAGAAGKAANLAFLRVDFEDQITGNLHDRVVEFRGRVRTLYGPVADWRDKLDPDPRDGLAEGVYLLTSDRLALAEMQATRDDQAAIEVVADGNAAVEGSNFTARAWRVSYARAKELLILQGDGRNDAELWLKGSVAPDAAAQQIRFWTKNNSIQVDGGRFFNLSQTGALSR